MLPHQQGRYKEKLSLVHYTLYSLFFFFFFLGTGGDATCSEVLKFLWKHVNVVAPLKFAKQEAALSFLRVDSTHCVDGKYAMLSTSNESGHN